MYNVVGKKHIFSPVFNSRKSIAGDWDKWCKHTFYTDCKALVVPVFRNGVTWNK